MASSFAVVLSGGSVRAAAHIGILKALEEHNLYPSMIVGTSGGAIVAALYACGMSGIEIESLFMNYAPKRSAIVDINWPGFLTGLLTFNLKRITGVVRGRALERLINEQISNVGTFAQLRKTQLLIPTVNLNTGQQTVFCDFNSLGIPLENGEYANFQVRDHLTIAQAVRASISIPGVFVPAEFKQGENREVYVDGGLRNGYPLSVAAKLGGAQKIIGVNLGYAGMRRDNVVAGGTLEILSQSLDILMRGQYKDSLNDQDLRRTKTITLNPLIYDIGTFDLEYIPQMIERGYEVAKTMLKAKGVAQGAAPAHNLATLFRSVGSGDVFPAQGTPYFEKLLHNQLKQEQAHTPPKGRIVRDAFRNVRHSVRSVFSRS